MSWFQLDTESVVGRAMERGGVPDLPSPLTYVQRGLLGFTILSIAGFIPWAMFGRWFYNRIGESGLYTVCALIFIGLSGPLLHRLILGPGSLSRFYKLFGVTFAAYSVLWIAGWFAFRGHLGSLAGLLAGTSAMGWMLARAFDAPSCAVKAILVLFICNSLGYFVGGWVEGSAMGIHSVNLLGYTVPKASQKLIAKLLWGAWYGIGLGAGLGWVFYLCQRRTQEALSRIKLSGT